MRKFEKTFLSTTNPKKNKAYRRKNRPFTTKVNAMKQALNPLRVKLTNSVMKTIREKEKK